MNRQSVLRCAYALLLGAGLSSGGVHLVSADETNVGLQQTASTRMYLPLIFKAEAPVAGRTFTVNNNADVIDKKVGDGRCETAEGNNVCTFRAAILEANALPGADIINVPAGAYSISLVDRGDHDILDNVTINGAGAAVTIIEGSSQFNDRVFDIGTGVTVTLSGVTVQNGKVVSAAGGGIDNQGNLTINNSTIRNNTALRGTDLRGGDGGGIRNTGTLTVNNSSFVLNEAFDDGGAISNNATMRLNNVTLLNNRAFGEGDDNGVGGAIVNASTTTVANATIVNSTIASNYAFRAGGGIRNTATLTLTNTIVANNVAPTTDGCSGTVSSGGNNIELNDTCKFRTSGDRPNTNPQFGPLVNNPTPVLSLAAGSPAIDTGSNAACLPTDQRGVARPVDGNGDGSAICDIGAFEFTR